MTETGRTINNYSFKVFPKGTAMLLNNASESDCGLHQTAESAEIRYWVIQVQTYYIDMYIKGIWSCCIRSELYNVQCFVLKICIIYIYNLYIYNLWLYHFFTPRTVHYEGGAVSSHARSLWRLETLRVVWVQHTCNIHKQQTVYTSRHALPHRQVIISFYFYLVWSCCWGFLSA